MAKILILIGAHLCTAPRSQKEAATLAAAGHEVVVAGVWFDPQLVQRDRALLVNQPYTFQPVLDFRPGRWERWGVRFQARVARELFKRWQIFSPALLGYGAKAMLRFALNQRPDLTIVHSEAGLWVGEQLLQLGWRVGVDFEDWFSQDLLPSARRMWPVQQLEALEQRLMQQCSYRVTTSHAMAETLAQRYQATPPTVIYNTFPPSTLALEEADYATKIMPSLHWFSQTIGPGRGLETLLEALPQVKYPVEIHLRGNCSPETQNYLKSLTPPDWRSRLFFHATVPNDELPVRIAEHDIGLALEQSDPPNHDLTVSNKLFQYLQAGLAVIVTNTAGQREILSQCPDAGILIPCDHALEMADAINTLISNPSQLRRAQKAARLAAEKLFSWEEQADRILKTLDLALAQH